MQDGRGWGLLRVRPVRVQGGVWEAGRTPQLTELPGQVILCTKEVSVGARKNAFALLLEMGRAFLRFGQSQEGEETEWGMGRGAARACPLTPRLRPQRRSSATSS